jgi:hypothetical protein
VAARRMQAAQPLMVLLLPTTLLPYAVAIAPREVVNFDFAWRYQAAVEPRYRQCVFEPNVSYADPGGDGQRSGPAS